MTLVQEFRKIHSISWKYLIFFIFPYMAHSQELKPEAIKAMVQKFKEDPRGPYKDIRWFCTDGTFRVPQERCPEPSPQRARYKDEVVALATTNHVFLGQILSTTSFSDFWDETKAQSRLKQYQLQKYLQLIDNGWVVQKAQFYRGALQAEDEEVWGQNFLIEILKSDKNLNENYFLIREAVRDLPHGGDDNLNQKIRATALVIANEYAPFMNLRIKLHGQPDESDLQAVRMFLKKHSTKITTELTSQLNDLIADLEKNYKPVEVSSFKRYLNKLPKKSIVGQEIQQKLIDYSSISDGENKINYLSRFLMFIRDGALITKGGEARLALMDMSLLVEKMLFHEAMEFEPTNLKELLSSSFSLGQALYGSGHLEKWEWESIKDEIAPSTKDSYSILELQIIFKKYRNLVEWGTSTIKTTYNPTVTLYFGFEPLSYGFIDDRIRQSTLLHLGSSVALQDDFFANLAGFRNQVMDISNQGLMRGLNPGYAVGELVVADNAEDIEVESNKIYIFERPPADLKPVAGIATVTEGNPVSHVQLLARNLGIPNAILSKTNLESLRQFNGKRVFYAVSNSGTLVMKLEEKMTVDERQLFAKKQRPDEMIKIPIEQIELSQTKVLNLREVRSKDSGKLCGPKAANLGELKFLFPDNVVEGMVIPFGVFLEHMEQPMPGKEISYWNYLNSIFKTANLKKDQGESAEQIEKYTLQELEKLRAAIKEMPLLPTFIRDLEASFTNILNAPIGKVPVFLRSDTNMEDLKDFTGAGLNLTVFNVVAKEKIIQGIKDVWASPYSERSFKWRQKYLLNPENVYPSILLIPSVDVEYSGVLITKDIFYNEPKSLTVAFSRGAGGAVDGQQAESYTLSENGRNDLIFPARELFYNTLPVSGGTSSTRAYFNKPVLNTLNFRDIRMLAEKAERAINGDGNKDSPALDIELGFKGDKLWLFQVRPFVENKKALASEYLQSITPVLKERNIPITTPIK